VLDLKYFNLFQDWAIEETTAQSLVNSPVTSSRGIPKEFD